MAGALAAGRGGGGEATVRGLGGSGGVTGLGLGTSTPLTEPNE